MTLTRSCGSWKLSSAAPELHDAALPVHDVCAHLLVTRRQRLMVPSILSTYAARFRSKEHSIAESSIRNARGGANPYLELYRTWQGVAEVLLSSGPQSTVPRADENLGAGELTSIKDPAIRHQVKLLIPQSEIDAIRDFLIERKMKSRGLVAGEDGSVSAKDGRILADPGFLDGLRKLMVPSQVS